MITNRTAKVILDLKKNNDWHLFVALAYYGTDCYINYSKNEVECKITYCSNVPRKYLLELNDEIEMYHNLKNNPEILHENE